VSSNRIGRKKPLQGIEVREVGVNGHLGWSRWSPSEDLKDHIVVQSVIKSVDGRKRFWIITPFLRGFFSEIVFITRESAFRV
jgi:hypothetical protein